MVCLIQIKQLSFQKLAKVAQTKEQMDRSNRLACGYSIIRAADIHRFLGLSMLRQKFCRNLPFSASGVHASAEPHVTHTPVDIRDLWPMSFRQHPHAPDPHKALHGP